MADRTPFLTVPIASAENVEAKGRRYLLEGRLQVLGVRNHSINAICRGNGEIYHLGYAEGHWWCHCQAKGKCSHLVALQLVCSRP